MIKPFGRASFFVVPTEAGPRDYTSSHTGRTTREEPNLASTGHGFVASLPAAHNVNYGASVALSSASMLSLSLEASLSSRITDDGFGLMTHTTDKNPIVF